MSNIQLFTIVFGASTTLAVLFFAQGITKLLQKRYTLITTGLVFLALVAGLRYIPNAIFATNGQMYGVPLLPNVLITDICPMFALVMFISMGVNNRFMVRAIAPISFLGGVFTTYGQFAINGVEQESLINGIFYDYQVPIGEVGPPHNFGYFSTHYLMMIAGLIVMVGMRRQNWRHMMAGAFAFGLFYAYVGIVHAATGMQFNVSGITEYDWTYRWQNGSVDGEYATLQEFFGSGPEAAKTGFFTISIALFFVINFTWIAISQREANRRLAHMARSFALASGSVA